MNAQLVYIGIYCVYVNVYFIRPSVCINLAWDHLLCLIILYMIVFVCRLHYFAFDMGSGGHSGSGGRSLIFI